MDKSYFNPRSPCGERRYNPQIMPASRNFNPRSPCGERHMALIHQTRQCIFQSTLPMRGATDMGLPSNQYLQISIHAPHAGSDRRQNSTSRIYKRGEDSPVYGLAEISIHAPHAGSDLAYDLDFAVVLISIHAPHAGSDLRRCPPVCCCRFQSTLPMRGATLAREEHHNPIQHFNPRSPCGERLLFIFFVLPFQ